VWLLLGVVAGWLAGLSAVVVWYHWQHNRWCYRQLLGGWLGAKLEFRRRSWRF
jgi:uncharacterized membrane protein